MPRSTRGERTTDEGGPVFGDWMAEHDSIDVDERGPGDDPDGDGIPNLLEYFFAGNRQSGRRRGRGGD